MNRITVYVPESLPDGTPTPPELLLSYENELLDGALTARLESGGLSTEGLTIFPTVIGVWRSPSGRTYREPMRLLCLDVVDAEALISDVRRVAERIRIELAQEVVYVTISPVDGLAIAEPVAA